MSLQPLRDFILVTKNDAARTTASGLHLAPATDEKVVSGTVVSVGDGHLLNDGTVVGLLVKSGDTVLFNKNLAAEVEHNHEKFYVLREEQILCVDKV